MNEPAHEAAIFGEALALPPAQRAAFLERVCADDPALRTSVEQLLQASARAGEFLETTPVDHLVPGEEIGSRIDRYKLLEKIGEGGCGVVYRAEQEHPVRREVALKVIKLGMDTAAVIARFEAERQALALMDHPAIARIFDAGSTPEGRPYFAMEYVPGPRLTDYCDQQHVSTAGRLTLFVQVCHAVQHAHQKGVIHRDLKPSNILVALHDGIPTPKVIDFGIAKATQGRLADATVFTSVEQFLGTPAYMSPEQIERGVTDIDTRTDIYSLGVLLYELLTGQPPFDPRRLRDAALDEVRRIIREVDPPRPSTRLNTLTAADRTLAAEHRCTAPAHLTRLLRGDLDWIAMKAIEKDRARRYDTAASLADDIQRHLRNDPITARPPSRAYALQKLARRHRTAFAAAGLVFAIAVGATLVSTWHAIHARRAEALAQQRLHAELAARQETDRQAKLAEQERNRALAAEKTAQEEAAISKAVNSFLNLDLLRQAAPSHQPDRDIKLRTVLDRAAERLGGKFPGQPQVEAAIHETLAATYQSLGDHPAAQRHLERALELTRAARGTEDRVTLAHMANLVSVHAAQAHFREAVALGEEVVATLTRVHGPEHTTTLGAINNLATVYGRMGRNDESIALLQKTVEPLRRLHGAEHPRTLSTLSNIANAHRAEGRLDEAEKLFNEVLAIRRRTPGLEHPDTIGNLYNLALVHSARGEHAQAAELKNQVLTLRQRVLGPEHPDTLLAMVALAATHQDQGKLEEAAALLTQTIHIQQRVVGAEHPNLLSARHNLARVHHAAGKFAEAEAALVDVVEKARRVLGPNHPNTLMVTSSLASAQVGLGKLAEADALLLAAHARSFASASSPTAARRNAGALRPGITRLVEAYVSAGEAQRADEWRARLATMPANP